MSEPTPIWVCAGRQPYPAPTNRRTRRASMWIVLSYRERDRETVSSLLARSKGQEDASEQLDQELQWGEDISTVYQVVTDDITVGKLAGAFAKCLKHI